MVPIRIFRVLSIIFVLQQVADHHGKKSTLPPKCIISAGVGRSIELTNDVRFSTPTALRRTARGCRTAATPGQVF